MENQPISIFNIGQRQEEMNAANFQQKRGQNPLFDPKVQKVGETMSFIIRPVPYVKNPLQSIASKNFYALQDGLGMFLFDSRTSFNRPAENHYEFCEASDLWSKFRNSNDPNIQKRTEWLRLQRRNYAYVVVVNMPADPTLNGQMRPMSLPMELVKAFEKMAKPSEQDIALGAVPVQPFDIVGGKNIKCTIQGHMQDGILMRKWTVEVQPEITPLQLPLGPNGNMAKVTDLKQEDVIKFFEDNQTIDLAQQYGYHEPVVDIKRRAKNLFLTWTADVPALNQIVQGYFPNIAMHTATDVNAMQPAAQPVPPAQPATVVAHDPLQAAQIAQPAQTPQAPTGVVLP